MADLRMPDPDGVLHAMVESDVHIETLHALRATRAAIDRPEASKYCPVTVTIDVAVDGTNELVLTADRTIGRMKDTTFVREPNNIPIETTIPNFLPVPMGTRLRTQDWEIHLVAKNVLLWDVTPNLTSEPL
jgi:hypothetical protein